MKPKKTIKVADHQAQQARAALDELFGTPKPALANTPQLEGDALLARKQAEAKSISSRIDFLRRKREAMS